LTELAGLLSIRCAALSDAVLHLDGAGRECDVASHIAQ
jgi:hypothetical protein